MSAVHANARVLQCNQFGMLVVLGILIFFPVGGLSAISFTNKTRQNGKIVQIFQKPTKKSERAKCEGTHGTYRGEPPQGYKRVYLTGEPKSGTTWLEVVVKTLAQKACSDPAHQCTYEKDCREMMTVPRTLPSLSRSTHLGSFFTMFDKHNVSPECDWFQQGFSNTMNRIKAIHSGHNLPPSNAASLAELCGFKGTLSLTMSSAERVRLGKAIEECARSAYTNTSTPAIPEYSQGCHTYSGATNAKRRLTREFDTVLLVLRDPREVAISSYFHVVKERDPHPQKMEVVVRQILPGITTWIMMRYHLAVLGGQRFKLLFYNDVRTSLDPYQVIAEALGFNMSFDALSAVREACNATKMHQMEKNNKLPVHTGKKNKRVRSAGSKTIWDYGLSEALLHDMEQFIVEVLPRSLQQHSNRMLVPKNEPPTG